MGAGLWQIHAVSLVSGKFLLKVTLLNDSATVTAHESKEDNLA